MQTVLYDNDSGPKRILNNNNVQVRSHQDKCVATLCDRRLNKQY